MSHQLTRNEFINFIEQCVTIEQLEEFVCSYVNNLNYFQNNLKIDESAEVNELENYFVANLEELEDKICSRFINDNIATSGTKQYTISVTFNMPSQSDIHELKQKLKKKLSASNCKTNIDRVLIDWQEYTDAELIAYNIMRKVGFIRGIVPPGITENVFKTVVGCVRFSIDYRKSNVSQGDLKPRTETEAPLSDIEHATHICDFHGQPHI